jgi:hypothetical protein
MKMDSLFDPDSDLCGSCGLDPCGCPGVEAARRMAPPPRFARPAAPTPSVARRPERPHTPHPVAAAQVPPLLHGVDANLGRAIGAFAEARDRLPPDQAAYLDLIMGYVDAARSGIGDALDALEGR